MLFTARRMINYSWKLTGKANYELSRDSALASISFALRNFSHTSFHSGADTSTPLVIRMRTRSPEICRTKSNTSWRKCKQRMQRRSVSDWNQSKYRSQLASHSALVCFLWKILLYFFFSKFRSVSVTCMFPLHVYFVSDNHTADFEFPFSFSSLSVT
jgi:hypothetical protein